MPPHAPESLVREHLERIVASPAFARADRLRRFLRFVVELTIDGRQDEIKESLIALDVCGRDPGFDARADPIVRVDANRLRARLQQYYQSEGQFDAIRIDLPKGTYVPAFVPLTAAAAPVPAAVRGTSVAVLPFVNLGPNAADEYFSDGLTEELIHQLSRVPGLRVIARTSAFQYRGRAGDLRRIAADLNVAHVVEGSVRSAHDQVRVTAQLTEVEHCTIRWSAKYERRLTDMLHLQDDICGNVTRALEMQLIDPARPRTRRGAEPGAHIEYLKGRYFWNRRTASSLARSLDHYVRAIEIDPAYAPAYCGVADTLLVQALNDQTTSAEAMPRAGDHARRALEIEPDLPDALISLAAIASVYEWDWSKGDRLFRRAIALEPKAAIGHYLYAVVNLAPRGQWDDALIEMDNALELDPVSPVLYRDLGVIHYLRGQYRDAEAAFQTAQGLDPGFHGAYFWLGRVLAQQGRFDEALAQLERRLAAPSANARVVAALAHTLAQMGRQDEARHRWLEFARTAQRETIPPLSLALAHLGLGEHDQALDCMEQACAARALPLYLIAVDPVFRPIRAHPRFAAVLRLMRLDDVSPIHS